MAAYGAAYSLMHTISKVRHLRNMQIFVNAVITLKCFLEENREVDRDFEMQIRDAFYEAQDIIDSVESLTQYLSPSEVEITMRSLAEDLWMVARRIDFMAQMTAEKFHPVTLACRIPNSVWKTTDEMCSIKINLPIVGRHEDIDRLKDRLMSDSEGLEVIPLVGIPGIGKTALAYCLLDEPSIRNHFKATGFVRISVKYDKRKALFDLLRSLKERAGGTHIYPLVTPQYKWSDSLHQKTNDQLVKHLQNSLKYKRYLIVLDDIREVAIWQDLKELFTDYYNRSRILITARNFDVAPGRPYKLDFVSDEAALALLMTMVFDDQPFPSDLFDIAVHIARSCRGFPHAVVTVAKLLKFANPVAEYWKMVLYLINTCGSRHADLMEVLLLLTYNHLPQTSKFILLYIAIFPYMYTFRFIEMVRLLIAEGLNGRMETLVFSFDILNSRHFLRQHPKFDNRLYTRYEIAEEIVHEFLVRKAEEEKFFFVINKDTSYASLQVNDKCKNQRRLCIQRSIYPFIKDLSKYNPFKYVRSILYYGPRNQYPLWEWPEHFKLLKVFDALKVRFYTFPTKILESVLLNYLALSYNGQLPVTVCNLRNLEFLIVSKYLNVKFSGVPSYLPAEIWNLKDLHHLQVGGSDLP